MIPCKLVHDTGTIVRFRTSQLPQLPASSCDTNLLLPNGQVVSAHFNRHPQNPNLSGRELVRFIKRRVSFKDREPMLLDRLGDLWVLHELTGALQVVDSVRVSKKRVIDGALKPSDLAALVSLADREADRGRRMVAYRRVLRPSGLRRLVLKLVGARCMVDNCNACDHFSTAWWADSGEAVVEVHHIEEVARTNDNSPRNLCVLCANHHRFVHSVSSWSVLHEGANVVMRHRGKDLIITRPPALFDGRDVG